MDRCRRWTTTTALPCSRRGRGPCARRSRRRLRSRELCARLDNLPLALELAAARVPIFSPEQLLERLGNGVELKGGRDADPRQQTLDATIRWSYDLLAPEERRLFARLAVFAGGCTYEAAEAVCAADADTLQSLIDKSLVRSREAAGGDRYWMLETIREFAASRARSVRRGRRPEAAATPSSSRRLRSAPIHTCGTAPTSSGGSSEWRRTTTTSAPR